MSPPQEWSEELGRLAGARAASCLEGPAPLPSPQLSWSESLLPAGTGGFAVVLEHWFTQGRRYDYRTGRCAGNATCRHYTQVGRRGSGGGRHTTKGGVVARDRGETCSLTAGVGHGGAAGLRAAPLHRQPQPQRGLRLCLLPGVRGGASPGGGAWRGGAA